MADAEIPQGPGGRLPPELRAAVRRTADGIPIDTGGGGSLLKALVLAELIVTDDLRAVVEIGVYRGRILLPLGAAMASLGRGEAIGIDPYTVSAAVQVDTLDRGVDLSDWPRQVDWQGLYEGVLERIEANGLQGHCRLVRETSAAAVDTFGAGAIDLLHVDGNHDQAAVERDVSQYLPKVRAGGFVVMDDASWSSVRPTCERLAQEHELVFQLFDGGATVDGIGGNDFAVFRLRSA